MVVKVALVGQSKYSYMCEANYSNYNSLMSVLTAYPMRMSHNCTVLSHPPETTKFSSSARTLQENILLECPGVLLIE